MVKWWWLAVSLAMGMASGFITSHLIESKASDELIRESEQRAIELNRTSRLVENTNSYLKQSLIDSAGIITGLTEDNNRLSDIAGRLTEKAQRVDSAISGAIDVVRDINDASRGIADTIKRIRAIVESIESAYKESRSDP